MTMLGIKTRDLVLAYLLGRAKAPVTWLVIGANVGLASAYWLSRRRGR